ncbi:hypothetical protein [Clostridium sp.]|uniref:hypothetical protein n=1 Tax=Clostridium sp. TaxID=1506 RepID=UPI003216FFA2
MAAIPSVQEYFATATVSYGELTKMNNAQIKMKDRINGGSESTLRNALNALSLTSGICGLFIPSTVLGLISATSGVAASLPSYKSAIVSCMDKGLSPMGDLLEGLYPLDKKYDLFEIEFLWLDFRTQGIRYFQGGGKVKRAHVRGGGWVSMSI